MRHYQPQPPLRQPFQPLFNRQQDAMMRGAGGALAVALAALLVCCSAENHQEQDVGGDHSSGEHYDPNGHKAGNVDYGGHNLVREVREIRHSGYVPYLISRRFDYGRPYGVKPEPWLAPVEYVGYYGDGLPKRNFDEIDRSGLDTFVKKRNFDEIDRSSLPFSYTSKRFNHVSNFDKKRYRPEYPMDEIDLSHLPIGSKRSQDNYLLAQHGLL